MIPLLLLSPWQITGLLGIVLVISVLAILLILIP